MTQQGGIRIGDLLVRAGVVTAADCAEAERLSAEMKAQFGRLLILAGCLTEEALACALEAQAFIKQGVISFDIAIEALAFAVDEKMSLEQALELLDLLPQFGTATLELAKLVGEASIVPEDQLIEALEHSVQTNIPLSEVLLAGQLISADMLGLLNVLHEQIRTNTLNRPLAVKDMRSAYTAWRRGNFSSKASHNKLPSYPQPHEVRKTFHQLKAMQPVNTNVPATLPSPAPSAALSPAMSSSPTSQPAAPSVYSEISDFSKPSQLVQSSQSYPSAPVTQSTQFVDVPKPSPAMPSQSFVEFQSDAAESKPADKVLPMDKLNSLKALAFQAPVGAPLPLLLDDSLPALPIAALQSSDQWNTLDGRSSSKHTNSIPQAPPQASFNPFAGGPAFYTEPVPAASSAPTPLPPSPAPASASASYALPSSPAPTQPPAAFVPPQTVVPEPAAGWDWSLTDNAPVEVGAGSEVDWSWSPSPEELAAASSEPSRFAWEPDPEELLAADTQAKERFVWEAEMVNSSITTPPVVESAPLAVASVETVEAKLDNKKESEPEPKIDAPPEKVEDKAKDTSESSLVVPPPAPPVPTPKSLFSWNYEPKALSSSEKAKTDNTSKPSEEAEEVELPGLQSLPPDESIAFLAEASFKENIPPELLEADASSDMAKLFKWDPPEYDSASDASPKKEDIFKAVEANHASSESVTSEVNDANSDEKTIDEKVNDEKLEDISIAVTPDLTLKMPPMSLGFERSSFSANTTTPPDKKIKSSEAVAETVSDTAKESKDENTKPSSEQVLDSVLIEKEASIDEPATAVTEETKQEVAKEPEPLAANGATETAESTVEPGAKKAKKKTKAELAKEKAVATAENMAVLSQQNPVFESANAGLNLISPENPDLVHILIAAKCFTEIEIQQAFVSCLNDPQVSLELLRVLNIVDKSTLDSAARINKLVKEGAVEMTLGLKSLTDIHSGELKNADLTKALGLDKPKPKAKAKPKRKK